MLPRLSALCLPLVLAGCATFAPSVPEGYTGPRAQLQDSVRTHSASKADFFVAEQIDGARIDQSLNETRRQNHGRGMQMTPALIQRFVVAGKPVQVAVMGRTHYAAPIQSLTGTVYQVKGVVEFTPKADGRYVVRGELGETNSAVWIEDAETSQVVGQKVVAKGDAKLGVMEK